MLSSLLFSHFGLKDLSWQKSALPLRLIKLARLSGFMLDTVPPSAWHLSFKVVWRSALCLMYTFDTYTHLLFPRTRRKYGLIIRDGVKGLLGKCEKEKERARDRERNGARHAAPEAHAIFINSSRKWSHRGVKLQHKWQEQLREWFLFPRRLCINLHCIYLFIYFYAYELCFPSHNWINVQKSLVLFSVLNVFFFSYKSNLWVKSWVMV